VGPRESFELGLTARAGGYALLASQQRWLDPGFSAGPDGRLWVSNDIGLQLSAEAIMGISAATYLGAGGSFTVFWRD